jgi:hypothetical protein
LPTYCFLISPFYRLDSSNGLERARPTGLVSRLSTLWCNSRAARRSVRPRRTDVASLRNAEVVRQLCVVLRWACLRCWYLLALFDARP